MKLVDQSARDAVRSDLDKTLVVEAAAGTGKTSELVQRMIAVIAAGKTTIDRIAGVTFTEKAAGELKLRLRSELERARRAEKNSATRNRLEQALAHLEEARLSTIHSFCGDLLRERPVEARIDPQFEVLTEAQSLHLYREAFRSWFERKLEDLPEGTRRILRRKTRKSPTETLISAGWELSKWRDFSAKWQRPTYDRQFAIDALVEAGPGSRRTHERSFRTGQQPILGHDPCADPQRKHTYRRTESAAGLRRPGSNLCSNRCRRTVRSISGTPERKSPVQPASQA